MNQGGDDLDDDFVIDDTVALSDEDDAPDTGFFSDATDGPEIHDHVGRGENEDPSTNNKTISAVILKKRKRREKEKERKAKRGQKRKLIETTEAIENSIAVQSPCELSKYLSAMQTKTFSKLSALELHDMHIPEDSIADTTTWIGPRTLDYLIEFIIQATPTLHTRLAQRSKSNGAPTLLFVTGAALRVVDVTRVLKDKKLRGEKGGEVAKLFAKHFKLSEHVTYLKRTKVGAAVGTPGRIGKLLCETDALNVSALSHIIIDVTYRDAKKRSLLDIPETRDEVFRTVLGGHQVLKAIREGKIQIILF